MPPFDASSTAEDVTAGRNLRGFTALVTGCNSGLGHETMRVLALRGARVIGAARSHDKAEAACASVEGDAVPLVCELSDPASVQAAVAQVREPLHAVIANAGIMALPELVLRHGLEAQMFTNHVGHFLLVTGLLDRLAPKGRVVMLSSGAHHFAKGPWVTFDDLRWTRPYEPWPAYGLSKLANLLFARELARRLPAGQTANAVHPGVIRTGLMRHLTPDESAGISEGLTFRSIPQGAATQVFAATHASVASDSGTYFADCARKKSSSQASDGALARKLWDATEAFVADL